MEPFAIVPGIFQKRDFRDCLYQVSSVKMFPPFKMDISGVGKYAAGYKAVRDARFKRQLKMGLVDANVNQVMQA